MICKCLGDEEHAVRAQTLVTGLYNIYLLLQIVLLLILPLNKHEASTTYRKISKHIGEVKGN